jgi:2-dehydropantoate 2-reductase
VRERRILVAGLGAIGGVAASYLVRSGADVTALDPWFEHVLRVRDDGLRLRSPDEEFDVRLPVLLPDELPGVALFDVVLLCVKSQDTEWMTRLALPYLNADGFIVSLQNGINEPRIAAIAGAERTVGAVVHMNAAIFEPGLVQRFSHPDWATYTLGELDGRPSPRVEALAELLGAAGRTDVSRSIYGSLWAKLAVNSMANPLGGITGLTSRQVWGDPEIAPLAVRLAAETVAVGEALGHQVEDVHPTGAPRPLTAELLARTATEPAALAEATAILAALAAARAGRENPVSLLQDLLKGRRTEIDYLNGQVVGSGMTVGVPTPLNAGVIPIVKEVERGRLERRRENALGLLDLLVRS